MKFHELEITPNKKSNRVGRGISAGQGKTAGRGTKGQNSRTGKKLKPGFEGGQTKLSRRLPKLRGFTHQSVAYQLVQVSDIAALKAKAITAADLHKAGLIKYADRAIKLVGNAELAQPLHITVTAATSPAKAAITKAGGSVTIQSVARKPVTKKPQLAA